MHLYRALNARYLRMRWEDVCREVGKLRVRLRKGGKVGAQRPRKARNENGLTDSSTDSKAVSSTIRREKERGGRDLNPRPPA